MLDPLSQFPAIFCQGLHFQAPKLWALDSRTQDLSKTQRGFRPSSPPWTPRAYPWADLKSLRLVFWSLLSNLFQILDGFLNLPIIVEIPKTSQNLKNIYSDRFGLRFVPFVGSLWPSIFSIFHNSLKTHTLQQI